MEKDGLPFEIIEAILLKIVMSLVRHRIISIQDLPPFRRLEERLSFLKLAQQKTETAIVFLSWDNAR